MSMNVLLRPPHAHPTTRQELSGFLAAYDALLGASREARGLGLHPRDAPVARANLRQRGVEDGVLLLLLFQRHVEHLWQTQAGTPRLEERVLLDDRSCFALTKEGESFAGLFLDSLLLPVRGAKLRAVGKQLWVGRLPPHYDKVNRVFTWGRNLLKHFRQPSENQETVLCSAQELNWPAWFDDPLPPTSGVRAKTRLHDTIKDLNRRQSRYLVHFKGDGTGTRIGWELPGG